MLHLLRDIRQLQSARHAHKSRHVGSLSEAVRAHAAHALTAHQMLLQESKRTLSHVRRFRNPALAPPGLEEQCEQALQKCRYMLKDFN